MSKFIFGIILFLTGIEGSKYSVNKLAEEKIKKILNKITDNFFCNIFIGIVCTALIQSSSAISILLIGLLDSSLLNLNNAIAIMIGANVGTTITAQLISIPIIEYYYVLIVIGLIITCFSFFYRKLKYLGIIFICFGLIFFGLHLISISLSSDKLTKILLYFLDRVKEKKLFTILGGTFVTALIQSSSIVTGVIIKLAENNLILFNSAVPLIIGTNLGTCITTFVASLNSSRHAKYLACFHFIFNVFGTILILPFIKILSLIAINSSNVLGRQIANIHTLFNIITLVFFTPTYLILKKTKKIFLYLLHNRYE